MDRILEFAKRLAEEKVRKKTKSELAAAIIKQMNEK
jgi:SRSO17 transposase